MHIAVNGQLTDLQLQSISNASTSMAIWENYARAVKCMLPFAHAVPVDRSTMDFVSPYRALLQSVNRDRKMS